MIPILSASMGWFDVCAAGDVGAGGIITIDVDSIEMVLWRTTAGELAACDSRCPHQWAHLGTAGAVDGDEIVCLSHFWRFDTNGTGSKLSATGRRDEKSPNRTFRVDERDGRILVWIDPSGDASSA